MPKKFKVPAPPKGKGYIYSICRTCGTPSYFSVSDGIVDKLCPFNHVSWYVSEDSFYSQVCFKESTKRHKLTKEIVEKYRCQRSKSLGKRKG